MVGSRSAYIWLQDGGRTTFSFAGKGKGEDLTLLLEVETYHPLAMTLQKASELCIRGVQLNGGEFLGKAIEFARQCLVGGQVESIPSRPRHTLTKECFFVTAPSHFTPSLFPGICFSFLLSLEVKWLSLDFGQQIMLIPLDSEVFVSQLTPELRDKQAFPFAQT